VHQQCLLPLLQCNPSTYTIYPLPCQRNLPACSTFSLHEATFVTHFIPTFSSEVLQCKIWPHLTGKQTGLCWREHHTRNQHLMHSPSGFNYILELKKYYLNRSKLT
jgi:hypothetical protein